MLFRALLFFFLGANAFACALCSLYSPTAHVQADFEANKTAINKINFTWIFSENFSLLTRENYDFNADGEIGKDELREIRRGLLDYLVPRGFLTRIEYFYGGEDAVKLEPKLSDYELNFEDGRLKFRLSFAVNLALKDGLKFSVETLDKEGYFAFKFLAPAAQKLAEGLFLTPNINGNIAFYELTSEKEAAEFDRKPSLKSLVEDKSRAAPVNLGERNFTEHGEIDAIDAAKFSAVSKAGLNLLDRVREFLRANSQNFSAAALMILAALSFGYGFLHAAGAGHGKTLTASYFAATGGSYARAALFALKIGFLHVIGAAALVFATYFTLLELSAGYVKDTGRIAQIISGAVIVALALFMLFKAFASPKIFTPAHKIYPRKVRNFNGLKLKFSLPQSASDCAACEAILQNGANRENFSKSRDWLTAAAAALVPCPGTIVVFTLAFELGSFTAGAISGVCMALGMSAVTFIAAVLGAKAGGGAIFRRTRLKFYLKIAAISVMLGLGVFMLFTNLIQKSPF